MIESTPAVRVTWRTAVPPECVAYVEVVFRLSTHGAEVTSYTTTNTSGTEVIQSPLQCATEYYVQVFVAAIQRLGGVQKQSIQKRVVVGGKGSGVHEISIATTYGSSFWSYFFIHNEGGWVTIISQKLYFVCKFCANFVQILCKFCASYSK